MIVCRTVSGASVNGSELLSSGRVNLPTSRVVVVSDPNSMETYNPQPHVVKKMVRAGIQALTETNLLDGWRSLVTPNDTIGIKVFSTPGKIIGTRPVVVAAVIEQLVEIGVVPGKIIIWDKQLGTLRLAGFYELKERYGVQIASSISAGWDPEVSYESPLTGKPVWGDFEFGKKGPNVGRKSYMSKLITKDITKHIVIVPLLNHNTAGVSGAMFNLAMGSVDNTIRFESRSRGLTEAVPEIFGKPEIFDRLAVVIVDGLICQYQGEAKNLLHYSKVLGQLRFSKDPVALDVLSIQEVERQRQDTGLPRRPMSREIFRNAELLELGVFDPRRIVVEMLRPPSP